MPKKGFSEEQIVYALRQVEAGTPVLEVCRKLGVTEQAFYRWKRKFAGLGLAELRRLRQLEDENRKLKQLVVGLTLDKHMLQFCGVMSSSSFWRYAVPATLVRTARSHPSLWCD